MKERKWTIQQVDKYKFAMHGPLLEVGEEIHVIEYQAVQSLIDELKGVRDAIAAKDELLVCYRIGKSPSNKLFKKLDKARDTLARIDKVLRRFDEYGQLKERNCE